MNILVTGGAGFIGSHLVNELIKEAGHEIYVLDNLSNGKEDRLPKGVHLVQKSLDDESVYVDLPDTIDVVFHLAAQIDLRASMHDPMEDCRDNILGTVWLLELCQKKKVKKLVFSSSAAVYGASEQFPIKENDLAPPESGYAISKKTAEDYIRVFSELHGFDHVVLRYANVYGPGQQDSIVKGVITIFANKVKDGEAITINGSGEQTRDFVYVGDVAKANIAAMKYDGSGTFNISSGEEISLNDLVQVIQTVIGKEVEVSHTKELAGEVMRSVLDRSLAEQDLGWKPEMSFEEGLRSMF